jgi:F-type H+-transporting ATPase subunit epsilon
VRLRITTPVDLIVDAKDVRHVRAEDLTGAFGIQPGHTEFVTVLAVSVLTYREGSGIERHVAVRGGVLRVRNGEVVEVATREAIVSDNLEALHHAVLAGFRSHAEAEAKERTKATQLNVALVRNLYRYVRGERDGGRGLSLGRKTSTGSV